LAANCKEFDDVNKAWANVDTLIYTSTIRAGCSLGIVIRKPRPINVPKDLKRTIAKDRKEVATIDDAQEAVAFNIDSDHCMELSAKLFLELEEKIQSCQPLWSGPQCLKALPSDMKLHDGIMDSIDLKCQSLNIIMCLLAMDSLNDVMPQTKALKFIYFAGAKTSTGT